MRDLVSRHPGAVVDVLVAAMSVMVGVAVWRAYRLGADVAAFRSAGPASPAGG